MSNNNLTMEKQKTTQSKHKNSSIMRFLPRATSAVSFQNPQSSSSENHNKSRLRGRKGFSGQVMSIIPAEARRGSKNDDTTQEEPTSPKVSCMGQIKHKKKLHEMKRRVIASEYKTQKNLIQTEPNTNKEKERKNKQASALRKLFSFKKIEGRKSDVSSEILQQTDQRAPSLGQIRRFASSRDVFANFDWTAQIAPVDSDHRDTYSDDEDSGGDNDEVKIPFSAPMVMGRVDYSSFTLEPRKEINIWKRRNMDSLRPLQLKTFCK